MSDKEILTFDHLLTACAAGGSSALRVVTPLEPAGGPGALVAPARVLERSNPTYSFERRLHIDEAMGQATAVWTVVIDSKQSVSNRDESSISLARMDGSTTAGALLQRVPSIRVTYEDQTVEDIDLPHRAFDGHIRSGFINGEPATQVESYRRLRNATRLDASALLMQSPTTLVYGGWDSTRKANQGRYQTLQTGEVIGTLADQDRDPNQNLPRRAAGRVDPVAASVKPDAQAVASIVEGQSDELSDKLQEKVLAEAKKKGTKGSSLSTLGLGHIPPTLSPEGLGGVSCSHIERRRVLSFSALRQLRFGGSADADIACRALLAAYGLLGMALSDQELNLRANCELMESGEPEIVLDLRYGQRLELAPITVEVAVQIFEAALAHAESVAGVSWTGQTLEVTGNQAILRAASADDPEE